MNMNRPDPELLSAYADGEVSESERALVEQWLLQNPRGRQEVARVHVLGAAIRSLPRENLPVDFAAALQQRVSELPTFPPLPPESQATGDLPASQQSPFSQIANGGMGGRRPFPRRLWMAALVAGFTVALPVAAWRLMLSHSPSDVLRGPPPGVMTDGRPSPAVIAESANPPEGVVSGRPGAAATRTSGRHAIELPGGTDTADRNSGLPGPLGAPAAPDFTVQQLRSQLLAGAADHLRVMTVQLAGSDRNPTVVESWGTTLREKLGEFGFVGVSPQQTLSDPSPREIASTKRSRPIAPGEVDTFFLMLEGDVDSLVAALEKTLEQTQAENHLVNLAEAELQFLDEELQALATSVLEELPAAAPNPRAASGAPDNRQPSQILPGAERGRMAWSMGLQWRPVAPSEPKNLATEPGSSRPVAPGGVDGTNSVDSPNGSRRQGPRLSRKANDNPNLPMTAGESAKKSGNREDSVSASGTAEESGNPRAEGGTSQRRVLIQITIPSKAAPPEADAVVEPEAPVKLRSPR